MKYYTIKIKFLVIILSFFNWIAVAQKPNTNPYQEIDKKILEIPDSLTHTTDDIASFINLNFHSESDKLRAIFIWVASTIHYDIDNMFAINFYEKREEKIAKPLKTHKGICENYAALFNDICLKSKIRSYVIEGYTKQNGKADYIPHAWCAALMDSVWYMFDPTWGSGYISQGKFIKKINNDYYKINPLNNIKSHMPFDMLWQFLFYPVSNQEFYEGKTQVNKQKPYFNYPDSILEFEHLDTMEQLIASAERIERNGVKNSLIYDRLQHLKLQIENQKQSIAVNLYNSAVTDYNDGVNRLNEFIQYRNKQFTPKKSDAMIQKMIDDASDKLNSSKSKLGKIKSYDTNSATLILQLTKSIDDVEINVNEQKEWLREYMSKGGFGRKTMFFK